MKATPKKAPAKATKAPAKKAAKPADPAGAIAPLPPHLAPTQKRRNPGVAHVPTEQTRALVALCMFANMTHEQAAAVVGIAKHTLEKHYAPELADGKAKMLAKVAGNLYSTAIQSADRKAANTAAIFILKQHGWRDDGMSAQVQAKQTAADGTDQVVTFTLRIGERGADA